MRKIFVWVMLLVCLCSFAAAEEVSFMPQLEEWDPTLPLEVVLSADVKTHMPFDDDRCGQLNVLLKHISLRLNTAQSDDELWSRISVRVDDDEVLSLTQCETDAATKIKLSSQPDVTYTGDASALNGLTGSEEISIFGLNGEEAEWLEAGYALICSVGKDLEEFGKKASIKTAIQNMGTARTKITYTVPKAEADRMGEALLANCPEGNLHDLLETFTFSGQQKLILWLNCDGIPLRAEYAGNCGPEGDLRKVSLVWRMRRDGTAVRDSLSLKTPAVKGADYNTLTYQRALVKGKSGKYTLDSEFEYTWKVGKEKNTLSGVVDLTNTVSGKKGKLSGTVTIKQLLHGEESYSTVKIKPALTISAEKASGTVLVQELFGKNVLEEAEITVDAVPGTFLEESFSDTCIDIAAMSDEDTQAMSSTMAAALIPHLVLLPEEDVLFLSADLSEDVWQAIVDAAKTTLEVNEQ